jgi:hypothetical protein
MFALTICTTPPHPVSALASVQIIRHHCGMEAGSIILRGLVLGLNYAFGALYALIVTITLLATPFIALGGDAGGRPILQIVTTAVGMLLVPALGGAWFLYTARVRNDLARARFLPLFWVAPSGLIAWLAQVAL